MPSSFSRFLDQEDLERMRETYLESLAALEAEEEAEAEAEATETERTSSADEPEATGG